MTVANSSEVAAYWENNAETWTRQCRAGYDVYRDQHNTPAFLATLPSIAGLKGLDIGCGEGSNTRILAGLGASMRGIDLAPTFIRHAIEAGGGVAYEVADATDLPFRNGSFDFVTAFMSLMDMADHGLVLNEAYRVLRAGGFLQFSILHPCFCPPKRRSLRNAAGVAVAVEVADYFAEADGRVEEWRFGDAPAEEKARTAPFRIPRFHRTLSAWLNTLLAAGFVIEQLNEPVADEATALAFPTVADTRVAPLFLHMRCRKGAT